jgi:EAL domain-containing protein (putative c-di-GMP-specific phosphodiesterase class I)
MAGPRGSPPARESTPQEAPQGPGSPGEPALRQLIYDNADGILVLRPGGVVVFANSAASHLLRPGGGPLVGTDFGHPVVAGNLIEIDIPATGHMVEMRVSQIEWDGAPALLSSLREITERRSAERSRLQLAAIDHYELLLRLRQNGDLLLPEAFMSAAERSGVIGDVDRWVVRQALKAISRQGDVDPVLSINLSGTSIGDDSLPQFIEHSICRHGLPPARLNFELSELAATAHLDTARRLIDHLHHAGCTVALDDFGSGFGSFRQLRYLPIDYLKIDGSLIRRLPGSDLDRLVVKAIVDVGRGLKRHTVAKHVNSEEALVLLRELGVRYGQGFHLGRPRPLDGSRSESAGSGQERPATRWP